MALEIGGTVLGGRNSAVGVRHVLRARRQEAGEITQPSSDAPGRDLRRER